MATETKNIIQLKETLNGPSFYPETHIKAVVGKDTIAYLGSTSSGSGNVELIQLTKYDGTSFYPVVDITSVTGLSSRLTTIEGNITTIQGNIITLQGGLTTLQGYFSNDKLKFASLPALYIGNAQVQSSSQTAQNIGGLGNVTPGATNLRNLGSSTLFWANAYVTKLYLTDTIYFEYVANSGNGYVKLNAPLVTDGDQIIISGTPGSGGSGGTIPYLTELLDVIQDLEPSANKMLIWTNSGTNNAGTTGGWALIDKSSVGVTTNATTQNAGLMSAADKTKLDSIKFGTQATDYIPITIGSTTKNVLTAHQSLAGYALESYVDSEILDAIQDLNLGAAATYGIGSVTSGNTGLVTGGAVWSAIDALPEPMVFKGSLGTGGTITALPTNGTANIGDTYKVITAGTYAGKTAKVGDTFICNGKTSSSNTWELIPSGDEPNGTVTSVALTVPTGLSVSGSPITTSGTFAITFASGYSIPTTANQTAWSNKYDKPSAGIPLTDLASGIQTSLGLADTAYQKPSTGIPATDLASAVQTNITNGATAYGYFSSDVLPVSHGGTGRSTLTSGSALIGNGTGQVSLRSITNNTTATAVTASTNLITANTLYYHKGNSNIVTVGTISSGTWQGTPIANAYLANSKITIGTTVFNLGDTKTAIEGLTKVALTNAGELIVGGAKITWVAPVGSTPGYLKIDQPLVTEGDQIILSGTPGSGGSGGTIPYLTELLDVIQDLEPSANKMLIWTANGTNNAGTTGGWTLIDKSAVGVTTAATQSVAGLMSAEDKTKLDNIAPQANKYVLPIATADALGGIKVGSGLSINSTTGVLTATYSYTLPLAANGTRGGIQIGYTQSGKNYPVQLSSEKAYVNVPWENTTYDVVTSSDNGLVPMFSTGNKADSASTSSYYFLGITGSSLKWYSLPANAFKDTTYSQGTGISISGTTISLASTYAGGTAVTLNGTSKASSTASFYAPTSGGTQGYVLKSNGSNAPVWSDDYAGKNHVYHYLTGNANYYSPYDDTRLFRIITENMLFDTLRFKASTVSNVVYWDYDSSQWVEWSGANLNNLFDGNPGIGVSISYAHRKFRFQITSASGWPSTGLFILQGTWFNSGSYTKLGDNYANVIIETRPSDDAEFATTCSFGFTESPQGVNAHVCTGAGGSLHNGYTRYRITIELCPWANTSNDFPLRRICILSNYSGNPLTTIRYDGVGNVYPIANNTYSLGRSGERWSTVYGVKADFSGNGTITGTVDIGGNLLLGREKYLQFKDSGGNYRTALYFANDNYLSLGYGTAGSGYNTYIYGKDLYFRYGTSRQNAISITSSGSGAVSIVLPTTLSSTLSVSGNTSIGGTLSVTGVATLSGGATIKGTVTFGDNVPVRTNDSSVAPQYGNVLDFNGRTGYIKGLKVFASEGDYIYCADRRSDYTITSNYKSNSSVVGEYGGNEVQYMFNLEANSNFMLYCANLETTPWVLTILKNPATSSITATDVLDLWFFQHNGGTYGYLNSYKVEVYTSVYGSNTPSEWYTVIDRSGVQDRMNGMILPVWRVDNVHGAQSTYNYGCISGIRITIRKADPTGSFQSGYLPISAIQLRDRRPSHKPSAGIGAMDMRGGTFYGDVTFDYGSLTTHDVKPGTNNTYSLGTTALRWQNIYGVNANFSGTGTISGNTTVGGTLTVGSESSPKTSTICDKLVVRRTLTNSDYEAIEIKNNGSWSNASGKLAGIKVTDSISNGTVGLFGIGYDGTGFFAVKSLYHSGYAATDTVFKVSATQTNVYGNFVVGTSSANKATTLNGTLNVTGATTLSSTLGVTGLTTLTGGATIPATASLKIGDATITWEANNGNGYLYIDKALVTAGDQIIISGTPGGGGGGGATPYLTDLLDVISGLTPTANKMLIWTNTGTNNAGGTGGWTLIDKSSVGVTTVASASADGLMSSSDWSKLNDIEANANNYVHPTNGANVTISAANGKVLSAITVNNLGHVTSVSSKTLAAADIPSITKSKISDFPTTWALANITGADDLKAIEALTGTSGFLKKTAANTWSLDTNTYLTGNQTIVLSGDVSGSGTTAIITTIGEGKVTNAMLAGYIANDKLANKSITIGATVFNLGDTRTDIAGLTSIDAFGLIRTTGNMQARKYYLSDSVYFELLNPGSSQEFVRLNAALVTDGDQIVIGGSPESGGTGEVLELNDLLDVSISPSLRAGDILLYDGADWVNTRPVADYRVVSEDGWHLVDEQLNVALKYDADGLDAAKISDHFKSLLGGGGGGGDFIQVTQDGVFFVDESLNIGVYIDANGIHANNILEYQIVNL